MRKKMILKLSLLTVFLTLIWSCQNDYLQEPQHFVFNPNASKFRILKLNNLPSIEAYLKNSSEDNFIFPLNTNKNIKDENAQHFGNVDPSVVVERTIKNETYYILRLKNQDTTDKVYNIVVKKMNDNIISSAIIIYDPDNNWQLSEGYSSFSGEVIAYDLQGNIINKAKFEEGIGECSGSNNGPGGNIGGPTNPPNWEPSHPGGNNGGGGGGTDPIEENCWDIVIDGYGNTLGYSNHCNGQYISLYGNKTGKDPITPDCGDSGPGIVIVNPQQSQNPCDKTKAMLAKPNVQQGINSIKAQALSTLGNVYAGEIGFKEKKDGTIVPADVNSNHKVVYNDVTDGYGGYHNHTATETHMFSPPDITETLFGFAAAQNNVEDAYFGMIAAEWCSTCPNNVQYIHYVIQYTGAASDLGTGGSYNFTSAQMTQFLIDYRKKVNKLLKDPLYSNNNGAILNNIGLEKLFFDTLKNIGINGKVNLQRIESNGVIKNITENSNGTINANPCP